MSLLAFANDFKIEAMTIGVALVFTGIYVAKLIFTSKSQKEGYVGFIEKYKDFLYELLSKKGKKLLILGIVIIVFIGSVATVPLGILKLELFPYEEPDSVDISITAPVGTLLDDTRSITYKVENLLFKYSDIESFNTSIGGNNENESSISVELVDDENRQFKNNDLIATIRKEVNQIPGAKFEVKAVTSMRKMRATKAIQVGLAGDDLDELNIYGEKYLEVLKGIDLNLKI